MGLQQKYAGITIVNYNLLQSHTSGQLESSAANIGGRPAHTIAALSRSLETLNIWKALESTKVAECHNLWKMMFLLHMENVILNVRL